MELGPREIHDKQFHDEWRGYNREEVDDFLDRAADALDQAQRSVQSLTERVRELEGQLGQAREGEQMLKKTLVTAQQHAEEAVATAPREGREDGRGGRRARTRAVGRSTLQGRFGRVGGPQENTGDRAGERTAPAPARFLRGEAAHARSRHEAEAQGLPRRPAARPRVVERTANGSGERRRRDPQVLQRDSRSRARRRHDRKEQRGAGSAGPQEGRSGSARPQEERGPARHHRRNEPVWTGGLSSDRPRRNRYHRGRANRAGLQEQSNNTGTGASAPERLADADAAGPLLDQGAAGGSEDLRRIDETEPPHETEPPGDGDEEENAARRTLRSLFGRDEE